jgi:hypothetical protein
MAPRVKIVWMFWQQGWHQAPEIVRRCHDSWVRHNPSYDVLAVDGKTLFDFVQFPPTVTLDREDFPVQKVAALGRLALLSRYGGAWADATVMCARSLDAWLDDYYAAGFFAFRDPGIDRLMSNWFIASDRDNPILQGLYARFAEFFARTRFTNMNTPLGARLLERYEGRWSTHVTRTVRWRSRFAREVLKVYPYFIFHYTFNDLILGDRRCAGLWHRAKPFPAEGPHRLQALSRRPDGLPAALAHVDAGETPMYKLDWRVDTSNPYWSAVLDHLEGVR